MKYILLGLLGWISCFAIFTGIGLVFAIASGMYGKDDIYEVIEAGSLIATSLSIVGCVLAIAFKLGSMILK